MGGAAPPSPDTELGIGTDQPRAQHSEPPPRQDQASNDDTPRRALVPVVREKDGVAYANSRDVAAFFGKRHADVMRDARNLLKNMANADLRWLTPATYQDEQGKERPCYHMTRDGLALLAMGFTGPKALAFKLAYIAAFNLMEGQIHLATEAELRAALASRSGGKVMGFSAEARHVLGGMVKGTVTAQHQAHQLQGQVAEKDRVIQEQAPKVATLHALTGRMNRAELGRK